MIANCRLPIPKISKSVICVNFRGSSEKNEIEDFCFFGTEDCRLKNRSIMKLAILVFKTLNT